MKLYIIKDTKTEERLLQQGLISRRRAEGGKATAICCNDNVELVCVGLTEAQTKGRLEALAHEGHQKNRWDYPNEAEYRRRFYWHTREVDYELRT